MSSKITRTRLIRIFAAVLLFAALALGTGCLCAFRDRNPGYKVDLAIPPKPAATNTLRAGFARVKISPDLAHSKRPIYLAGFRQNRKATAIHDDLWAIACVLDDGRTRLGIVALDAIGFFHDDVISVRKRLAKDWKLDYTIVCSTHDHTTPDLLGLWGPNYLRTGVNKDYRQQVIASAAKVLGEAVAALRPVQVAFREIKTAPEGLVADMRKPEVFDPDIRVMHFTDPTNGMTIGTIIGWADHPETLWSKNTEITADYPGYLRDALENGVQVSGAILEPGIGGIHLYVNGAVGGLMSTPPTLTVHDPFLNQDFKEPTHEKARALGRQLAQCILAPLEQETNNPAVSPSIAIRARTIEVPLANIGYLLAPLLGLIDRGHVHWKRLRTEVALVTIGDASIACVPGEIYPEIVNGGVEKAPGGDFPIQPLEVPPIRAMMPGKTKFLFGLANDEIGYIIPKSEWDRKKPYIYGEKKKPYGEINSCGPEVAPKIHAAMRQLCDEMSAMRGSQDRYRSSASSRLAN